MKTPADIIPAGDILERWYEASAYADHIPKELPQLIQDFIYDHGSNKNVETWEIITESGVSDSWTKLFECIFAEGAKYALLEADERGFLHPLTSR